MCSQRDIHVGIFSHPPTQRTLAIVNDDNTLTLSSSLTLGHGRGGGSSLPRQPGYPPSAIPRPTPIVVPLSCSPPSILLPYFIAITNVDSIFSFTSSSAYDPSVRHPARHHGRCQQRLRRHQGPRCNQPCWIRCTSPIFGTTIILLAIASVSVSLSSFPLFPSHC